MSSFRWRGSAGLIGLATLIGFGLVGSAVARPNIEHEYQFTERQLAKAKERVALLEARLQELALERARLKPPAKVEADCEQPFVFDSSGIKLWRSECSHDERALSAKPEPLSCAMPFRVDRNGIKHVDVECIR